MTNMTSIASKVHPYITSTGIHTLYISTDVCDSLAILRRQPTLHAVTIVSPCDTGHNPLRGGAANTLRLFAEIEMMRNGTLLFNYSTY